MSEPLTSAFLKRFGPGPEPAQFFCPGRVNIIGEHLDYNGGQVLPMAISLGTTALFRRTYGRVLKAISLDEEEHEEVRTDAVPDKLKDGDWRNYLRGVLALLISEQGPQGGGELLIASNLPRGAGLSSSASLEVLLLWLLQSSDGVSPDRIRTAKMAQAVEQNFVGVRCGIMDQFSVAMGRTGHCLLLDCLSLAHTYIPFALTDCTLLILDTNKKRSLAESRYNARRSECEAALTLIQSHREVPSLAKATARDLEQLVTDPVLRRRARHVVTETARVTAAAQALQRGEAKRLGELLSASHSSLKNDFEVTGVELDAFVEEALSEGGCLGARMTGAGFAGCAIALVATDCVEKFLRNVPPRYQARTGLSGKCYQIDASAGVRTLTGL